MKTEYILYLVILVVVFAFASLFYIYMLHLKKNRVRAKVNLYLSEVRKRKPQEETYKRVNYVEKNRKYMTMSFYSDSIKKLKNY